MSKVFQTRYEGQRSIPEINSGEIKVEKAGYISAKQQIETMIFAGMRLNQARKEQYDFNEDQEMDDTYTDPTRDPNFDMSDATIFKQQLEEDFAKATAEAEAIKQAELEAEKEVVPE